MRNKPTYRYMTMVPSVTRFYFIRRVQVISEKGTMIQVKPKNMGGILSYPKSMTELKFCKNIQEARDFVSTVISLKIKRHRTLLAKYREEGDTIMVNYRKKAITDERAVKKELDALSDRAFYNRPTL